MNVSFIELDNDNTGDLRALYRARDRAEGRQAAVVDAIRSKFNSWEKVSVWKINKSKI